MEEFLAGKRGICRHSGRQQRKTIAIAVALLGVCGSAVAFEIPTGSEDVTLRWDNTFRYTLADRVEDQKKAIIGNPNNDDGDRNFDRGIVSNRLDLLSEADLVYKKDYGIRISGAGWYDQVYKNSLDNSSPSTSNHLVNGIPSTGLSSYNEKYFAGPGGELLDAFVFGKFLFGDIPLNVKVGRHTVYWGEALGLAGTIHGVSYAQSPLDIGKGLAMPGAEAKELFRPLNNISLQIQPTSTLTIAGQYFLEWEANKFAEAGSYLGMYDMMMNNPESLYAGPGQRLLYGSTADPKGTGDWGISTRWSPEWLEGTLGLYYRRFTDKFPQLHVRPGVAPLPAAAFGAGGPYAGLGYTQLGPAGANGAAPFLIDPSASTISDVMNGNIGKYYLRYADKIDLYGISFSQNILGVSIGTEVSYRRNMPLVSDPVMILPAPLANPVIGQISAVPGAGETGGARGDTWHALVNFIGIVNKTPLFDTATWSMEYVYNRLDHVTSGAEYYKGRNGYSGIDKPTRDFVGGAVNFTPTWYQPIAGVDLSMPLSVNSGLIGNSAVTMGGNKKGGSYSVGVGADIFAKYKADLKYTDYFGQYDTDPNTGAVTVANGANGLLSDRGMVTLTIKATF